VKKKPGLFSRKNSNDPLAEAPWGIIHNMLFQLAPGDKIPIPATRSSYEEMRKGLVEKLNDRAQNSIEFIDFLFKHEKLGNVVFEPEVN